MSDWDMSEYDCPICEVQKVAGPKGQTKESKDGAWVCPECMVEWEADLENIAFMNEESHGCLVTWDDEEII